MHDIHAHLFHPRWYPRAFQRAILRDFQRRQMRRRQSGIPAEFAKQLLRIRTDDTGTITLQVMDKVGIDKRVILVLDWGIELGEAEKSIWEIHQEILGICRRFDDRLIGFAGVDPRRKDATKLLAWAFEEMGARGLKLHPTGGWSLTEERTLEIVSIAAERKLPVLVHLGKTVDVLSDVNAQPHPFMELAGRFPEIPFIAGHSGFNLWKAFVKAKGVPANIYFDISGWQQRIRGNGTNIVADLLMLHEAFPGRVCFGTDSPFYTFNLVMWEKQWQKLIFPPLTGRWANVDAWLQPPKANCTGRS
jgi:uncharacterized protein